MVSNRLDSSEGDPACLVTENQGIFLTEPLLIGTCVGQFYSTSMWKVVVLVWLPACVGIRKSSLQLKNESPYGTHCLHSLKTPSRLYDSKLCDGVWYDDCGNPLMHNSSGTWILHPGFTDLHIHMHESATQDSCQANAGPTEPIEYAFKYALAPKCGIRLLVVADNVTCNLRTFIWCSWDPAYPALVPLPSSSQDADLIVPAVILQSQGQAASPKVAGACCPGKEKTGRGTNGRVLSKGNRKENAGALMSKKQGCDVVDLNDEDEMKVRQGCPQGAGNYSSSDMNVLLDYVEEELLLGQRGWQSVTTKFNKWAVKYGRPERKVPSLEMKYKQLIKTPKPTGTGVCPPKVLWAHHIDDLINEQAADKLGASDDDNTNPPPEPCHTSVAQSACAGTPPTCHNARGAAATELMNCLSNAFDPEVQRAHDEECTNHALATTQFMVSAMNCMKHSATVTMQKCGLKCGGWPVRMYHNLPKHKWQSYKWFADGGESLAWLSGDEEDFYGKGSASETGDNIENCGNSGSGAELV
ncbi:hypothetical protein EDD17DRAFT_1898938 [Pisolithus thermaeus]|nr:hypothetical protein EV401DRAFT_2198438 [Pisolithus croceorrhizus]KAI6159212.1 hypothetical protein EDD17DRAFT_1898938 [Pisolithus thermaeus]